MRQDPIEIHLLGEVFSHDDGKVKIFEWKM